MKVKGVSWIGIGTDDYAASLAFYRNLLGLEVVAGHEGQAILRADNGDLVELFGRDGRGKSLTSVPVPAFEVDDVTQAKVELKAAGVELVGDVGSWNGFEWLYFRSPEGHLLSVKKTPASGWEKS